MSGARPTDAPVLVVVGVNHRTAPLEVRETLAFAPTDVPEAVRRLQGGGVREAAIIATCNRCELYTVGDHAGTLIKASLEFLREWHGVDVDTLRAHTYRYDNDEAARHFFRVAASLDSMVIGEAEILGQVKQAFSMAVEAGTVGRVLRVLFETGFGVAKRVRHRTAIGRHRVSTASAAVELSRKFFDRLDQHRVLVIGSGEIAAAILLYLRSAGADAVQVTSRTFERAAEFAAANGADAIPIEQMDQGLIAADLVLVGTGARDYVLTQERLRGILRRRHGRRMLLIDLSVPRNVEPSVSKLPDCYLYNVDDLQTIVEIHRRSRERSAEEGAPIIEAGLRRLRAQIAGPHSAALVRELLRWGGDIRCGALEAESTAMSVLLPDVRERLQRYSQRLLAGLLHPLLAGLGRERAGGWHQDRDWPLHRFVRGLVGQEPGAAAGAQLDASCRAVLWEIAARLPGPGALPEPAGAVRERLSERMVNAVGSRICHAIGPAGSTELAGLVVKMYTSGMKSGDRPQVSHLSHPQLPVASTTRGSGD